MVTIVTHCYRYSRVWRYQLRSMADCGGAGFRLIAYVADYNDDPDTHELLSLYSGAPWLDVRIMPLTELLKRPIGRNQAAIELSAMPRQWVWFADADYFFTPQLGEVLAALPMDESPLWFPRKVLTTRSHQAGEKLIHARKVAEHDAVLSRGNFKPDRISRATGGIQFCRSDALSIGYVNFPRSQRPETSGRMANFTSDRKFRLSLGTGGKQFDAQGTIYRIRHVQAGRFADGVFN